MSRRPEPLPVLPLGLGLLAGLFFTAALSIHFRAEREIGIATSGQAIREAAELVSAAEEEAST